MNRPESVLRTPARRFDRSGERDPRTHAIIGAAMEVHRQLGRGFLEPVYQDALAKEFGRRGIPFEREVELAVYYKGDRLNASYRADFVCYDKIVVELKALTKLSGVEEAQIINYLKAGDFDIGLLLNFGAESLQCRRFTTEKALESQPPEDR